MNESVEIFLTIEQESIMIIFEKEAISINDSRPIYFIKTIVIFGEGIYFC